MKRVVKSILLFLASTTYAWLLFLTATGVALRFTLSEPDTVKMWFKESGVYSNIVDEVSKLATIQQKQENSLVQITSEDIRETAKATFTPSGLEQDGNNMVDGFYAWFKGETTGPEFNIDFSSRQAAFAKAMTQKLEQKINALPECEVAGRFTVQAFDPFKADCRPKDVDLTEELASFEEELASSESILPQRQYTGGDITIHNNEGEARRVGSVMPWVPNAYKALLWAPWVLIGLTILAGLTMIFMSTSRRKGVKRFAGGLMFTGVILLVSGFFLRPAFERLNSWSTDLLGSQASFNQNILDPIFYEINKTYSWYSIVFGIIYTVPALITYGILLITRAKTSENDVEQVPQHLTPSPVDMNRQHLTEQVSIEEKTTDSPTDSEPQTMPTPPSPPEPGHLVAKPPERPITRRPPMIQG